MTGRSVLASASPQALPLVVDGQTPFVATSPAFLAKDGTPLIGRTVSVMLTSNGTPAMIHPAFSGYALSVGGGIYTRVFPARLLPVWLAPFAGQVVSVRFDMRGVGAETVLYRVDWRVTA